MCCIIERFSISSTFQFSGYYTFKFPIPELAKMVPKLDGMEMRLTAIVGDGYRYTYGKGYSTTRFYNSSLKLSFIGGSPQVIKPAMPFTAFVSILNFYQFLVITNVMCLLELLDL